MTCAETSPLNLASLRVVVFCLLPWLDIAPAFSQVPAVEYLKAKMRQNYICPVVEGGRNYRSWCNDEFVLEGSSGQVEKLALSDVGRELRSGSRVRLLSFERIDAQERRHEMMVKDPSETRVPAPSFDCGNAKTTAEKLICSSYRLSLIDSRFTASWTKARTLDTSREAVKTLIQINRKMQACTNDYCVEVQLAAGSEFIDSVLKSHNEPILPPAIVAATSPTSSSSGEQYNYRSNEPFQGNTYVPAIPPSKTTLSEEPTEDAAKPEQGETKLWLVKNQNDEITGENMSIAALNTAATSSQSGAISVACHGTQRVMHVLVDDTQGVDLDSGAADLIVNGAGLVNAEGIVTKRVKSGSFIQLADPEKVMGVIDSGAPFVVRLVGFGASETRTLTFSRNDIGSASKIWASCASNGG